MAASKNNIFLVINVNSYIEQILVAQRCGILKGPFSFLTYVINALFHKFQTNNFKKYKISVSEFLF